MNFNENIRNEWKIAENGKDILPKLSISHLFITQEYQTGHQSNAKT